MTTCMIDFPPPSTRRARGSSRGCDATLPLMRRARRRRKKIVCGDEPRRRFHSKRFTTVASQRFTQSLSAVSVCHALLPLSNEDVWPQTHVTSDTHSISQKWKKSNDCHSEASSHCCLINITRLCSKSVAYLGLSRPLSANIAERSDKRSAPRLICASVAALFVQRRGCASRRRALTAVGCRERDEFAP